MKNISRNFAKIIFVILSVFVIGTVSAYADEVGDNETVSIEDNDEGTEDSDTDDAAGDDIEEKIETVEEYFEYDELGVTITSPDGEYYALKKDETLYINKTVRLNINDINDNLIGDITNEENSYSFSYDNGMTFEEKNTLKGPYLELSPIRDGDECYVRFYKRIDTKMTEKVAADSETSYIIKQHIAHNVYSSRIYHIVFDTSGPEIDDKSDVDWDKWVNYDRCAEFVCSDSLSELSRVIIRTGETILYEYHMGDGVGEREISTSVSLDVEAPDINGNEIKIAAVDIAGNYSEKSFRYYLDKSCPVLVYSGPTTGTITSKDVQTVFSASDTIMEVLSLEYSFLHMRRGQENITETDAIFPNGDKLELARHFSDEGEYDITVVAVDRAGNKSEAINIKLRIDKTAPVITLSGFEKNKDYTRDVNVQINVAEIYYNDCQVAIKVTKKWPGGSDLYYEESGPMGDIKFNCDILFGEDGDYYIDASASDAAGNNSHSEAYVRVDKTRPVIYINGITDKQITKGRPQLLLTASELFYDSASIETSLYRKINGDIYSEPLITVYSMSSDECSFPLAIDDEGDYLLIFNARDRSGNSSECRIEFVYDCTSPTIGWIQNFNRKYLKSFSFPRLFSANITDATQTMYKAYLNTSELREGDEITKDGKYVLRIIATDAAGNVNDESVEFIVDATPPKIVAKGLDDSMNVRTGTKVSFTLYDKDDFFRECKYKDEDMELSEDGRTCTAKIDGVGNQTVKIVAEDLAGNTTEKLFVLNASALGNSGTVAKVVKKLTKSIPVPGNANAGDDSVKIDKNMDLKFSYTQILACLGIFAIGIAILLGFRHIDTTK